jgi:hypothetical protein
MSDSIAGELDLPTPHRNSVQDEVVGAVCESPVCQQHYNCASISAATISTSSPCELISSANLAIGRNYQRRVRFQVPDSKTDKTVRFVCMPQPANIQSQAANRHVSSDACIGDTQLHSHPTVRHTDRDSVPTSLPDTVTDGIHSGVTGNGDDSCWGMTQFEIDAHHSTIQALGLAAHQTSSFVMERPLRLAWLDSWTSSKLFPWVSAALNIGMLVLICFSQHNTFEPGAFLPTIVFTILYTLSFIIFIGNCETSRLMPLSFKSFEILCVFSLYGLWLFTNLVQLYRDGALLPLGAFLFFGAQTCLMGLLLFSAACIDSLVLFSLAAKVQARVLFNVS